MGANKAVGKYKEVVVKKERKEFCLFISLMVF